MKRMADQKQKLSTFVSNRIAKLRLKELGKSILPHMKKKSAKIDVKKAELFLEDNMNN